MKRHGRLWVPEAPMLNLLCGIEMELASPAMGIAGVYGYEVGPDLAAGQVRERAEFRNIITDAGLDALGGGDNSLTTLTSYFAVGTGTAPPAVGDGALQSQVGARINATGGFSEVTGYNATTDPNNPYWYRRIPRVWAKGAFGGDVNLTELGVFSAATGGVCWSRQLFRDGAGLPTTVTVRADEELKVWYEYRVYPPMTDIVQTLSIKGVSTTVTNRATCINNNNWGSSGNMEGLLYGFGLWSSPMGAAYSQQALPSRTSGSLGASADASTTSFTPYVGGSRQRGMSLSFSPAKANFAGGVIGLLGYGITSRYVFMGTAAHVSHFSPYLVKTTEEYLTAGVTFSWARTPNPTIPTI